MNRRMVWLVVGALALSGLVVGLGRAGELQPPSGAVAPTGPNIITEDGPFPLVISEAGTYVLIGNVTVPADTDGIRIAANGVTIDLRGFSFNGAGSVGTGIAPEPLAGGEGIVEHRGLVVQNGSLLGWADAAITLGRAGPGQDDAVLLSSSRFTDLHIQGPGALGVEAGPIVNSFTPISNFFERISVNGATGAGMDVGFSAVVRDCRVTECGGGIIASESLVSGCYVAFSSGTGISASDSTVERCVCVHNGTFGISAITSLVVGNTSRLNGSGNFQNLGNNTTGHNRF